MLEERDYILTRFSSPAPIQERGKAGMSSSNCPLRKMSQIINIKPVEIIGNCPAQLRLTDLFQFEDLKILNPQNISLCFLAISNFPIVIWKLQSNQSFFAHSSCPGCTLSLKKEKRVIFLLGQSDKWDLCLNISEYRRLSKIYRESRTAKSLKETAIQLQSKGQYSEATTQMEAALQELQKFAASKQTLRTNR